MFENHSKLFQKPSENRPTLVQTSTKMSPKIDQNRSQGPLGEVWGPSWPQDGLRPPQELQNPFRWTPLGVEVGGQNRPKISLEAIQNVIFFWWFFGFFEFSEISEYFEMFAYFRYFEYFEDSNYSHSFNISNIPNIWMFRIF